MAGDANDINAFDADIIMAYVAICRGYQVEGLPVLQAFAGSLDVVHYLQADPGIQADAASEVFSVFVDSTPPCYPLVPEKRRRGIHYLRQILRVDRAFCPEEEKEKAYTQLCNQWFCASAIQGEGWKLPLHAVLPVTLPKGFLLLCDLFLRRPNDLLHFFMEEVVLQMHENDTEGAAVQFLLHCASLQYAIKHN